MNAKITWLDDPEVFGVNTLKAHSDHSYYATKEEMLRKASSLIAKPKWNVVVCIC